MEGGQQKEGWAMIVESIMSASCTNHFKIIFTVSGCFESHNTVLFLFVFVYVEQCISYSANAWRESLDMNIWVSISKQLPENTCGLCKMEIEGEGAAHMNRTHYLTQYSCCFTHFHSVKKYQSHSHVMLSIRLWKLLPS